MITRNRISAAILMGLCWAAASGAAQADTNTAMQQLALHKACVEKGGRFEQSWIYNDQGVQWGKVVSCSTSAGYVTCQGNTCRGSRWAHANGSTGNEEKSKSDGAVRFPAEPVAFSAALSTLSGD